MRRTTSKFTEEKARRICDRVAAGESVRSVCRDDDMPDDHTVIHWQRTHPDFAADLRRAREASGQGFRANVISNAEKWKFYGEVVLPYRGDECLTWPFSVKGSRGYAAIYKSSSQSVAPGESRVVYISRLLCEIENGPPPSPKHEAAHTCGRGKFGCVTARHLVWKTVQENNWDKDSHGTRVWGEQHPDAILTAAQVLEIRARCAAGERQCDLAKEFGIAKTTMSSIINRHTWKRI